MRLAPRDTTISISLSSGRLIDKYREIFQNSRLKARWSNCLFRTSRNAYWSALWKSVLIYMYMYNSRTICIAFDKVCRHSRQWKVYFYMRERKRAKIYLKINGRSIKLSQSTRDWCDAIRRHPMLPDVTRRRWQFAVGKFTCSCQWVNSNEEYRTFNLSSFTFYLTINQVYNSLLYISK